ncbi:zinc finger and SCAN domain-containing protein 22-like isoform X2 [Erythrolamprus reginae]|uniref:zinc finger and SCAN domain-containing protein 22-like isoform X2 n=1 Tax=Erythrolamprus reginae TaxID=121349 RepID=UPI00396CA281
METTLTFRKNQLQPTSRETNHSTDATKLPSSAHCGNTKELLPKTTSQEGPPKTSQCWKDTCNGSSLKSISSQSAVNHRKLQSNKTDSNFKSSESVSSSEEFVAGEDIVPEVVAPSSLPLKDTLMLQLHLEDDIEDYLEGFESVACINCWPRTEWVAKLKPHLSRKALLACSILEPNLANDYDVVKERILHQYGITTEIQHQCFRQFRYKEALGPRETYRILQVLGQRWLKPERHTKEQILELLILEQFLIILPPEIQDWVRECCPETCAQVVDLVESFQLGNEPPVPLKDIDVKFSNEEWDLLTEEQRALYDDVTLENYKNLSTLGNQLPPTVIQGVEKRSLKRAAKTVKVQDIAMEVPQNRVSLEEKPVEEEPSSGSITEAASSVLSTSNLRFKKPLVSPKHKSSKRKKHQPSRSTEELVSTKARPQPSLLQEISGNGESSSQILTAKASKQKKTLAPQSAQPSQLKKPTASVGKHPKQKKKSDVLNEPPKELNKETLLAEKTVQEKDYQLAFLEVKVHEAPLPITTWNPPSSATVVSDLTCLECGKSFKQRFDLRQHRYVHTREKPYACTMCEKCFRHPSNLHVHLRTHSGERPYQCLECGKAFSQSCNLQTHYKIHTGNKPYKCFVCNKSFCHSSNLIIHQRIHTGERPYPCSVCSKCFSERSTLVQHERTHTGEKPYTCVLCGQKFSQSSHLMKHRRMHLDDSDPVGLTEDPSSKAPQKVFMQPGGKASF